MQVNLIAAKACQAANADSVVELATCNQILSALCNLRQDSLVFIGFVGLSFIESCSII